MESNHRREKNIATSWNLEQSEANLHGNCELKEQDLMFIYLVVDTLK